MTTDAADAENTRTTTDDVYTGFHRDVMRELDKHPYAFSLYALLVIDADPSGVSEMSIRGMAEHGGVTELVVRTALEAILETPYAERLESSSRDGDHVAVRLRVGVDYTPPRLGGTQ